MLEPTLVRFAGRVAIIGLALSAMACGVNADPEGDDTTKLGVISPTVNTDGPGSAWAEYVRTVDACPQTLMQHGECRVISICPTPPLEAFFDAGELTVGGAPLSGPGIYNGSTGPLSYGQSVTAEATGTDAVSTEKRTTKGDWEFVFEALVGIFAASVVVQ